MCSGEKYNPESNTWSPIPDIHNSQYNFVIEVMDDRIFVIGGYSSWSDVACFNENDKMLSLVVSSKYHYKYYSIFLTRSSKFNCI
jgi:hypothetical protein